MTQEIKSYTSESKKVDGDKIVFEVERLICGGPKSFISIMNCFATPEQAKKDAVQTIEKDSNIVWVGCEEVRVDGTIYYQNGYNVWN